MKREITSLLVLVLVIFSLNQLGFAQAASPSKETGKSVININTAGQAELERLPGIGPSLAKKILDFRQKNGQFKTPNDLMAVPGIGEKKFEQLKNLITVK
ncbi:helix-hairpin-helix domain-containing protein [bacterium]|nr:helix-hairpin-helix domain-containing protein [bacterium]MCI0601404.1 helix-hairpin-helix domain-containing protein [bacterium]